MVSAGSALLTRNLNAIRGVAENLTTSAPSILKPRSGMHLLSHNSRPGPEVRKEVADLLPNFRPTCQAVPVNANQADQLVACIYRDNVILRQGRSSRLPDSV